jgi:hypothetical protein
MNILFGFSTDTDSKSAFSLVERKAVEVLICPIFFGAFSPETIQTTYALFDGFSLDGSARFPM